jgi:hypothetical protein
MHSNKIYVHQIVFSILMEYAVALILVTLHDELDKEGLISYREMKGINHKGFIPCAEVKLIKIDT